MLRKSLLFLLVVAMLALAACGPAAAYTPAQYEMQESEQPGQIEMFFIYEEICANCDGTEDFAALVDEHLGDINHPYVIEIINVYHAGGQGRFEFLAQELLYVDASTLVLPVLIVNGLAYQGMNAIASNLREAVLTAGNDLLRGHVFNPRYQRTGAELFVDYVANPDHLTLVFFYRTVCPACIEIEPLIEALPETVVIDDRMVYVDLIRINTRSGNNREKVLAFFEAYDVPDQYRRVPSIFTASGFYVGPVAIAEMLEVLGQSDRIGFQFPEVN